MPSTTTPKQSPSNTPSTADELSSATLNKPRDPRSPQAVASIAPAKLPPKAAVHKPFKWLDDGAAHDAGAELAALTMDVCQGIEICLEIVSSSDAERAFNRDADPGQEELPLIDENGTGRLMRLAMASVRLLAERAEGHIDFTNKKRAQIGGAA